MPERVSAGSPLRCSPEHARSASAGSPFHCTPERARSVTAGSPLRCCPEQACPVRVVVRFRPPVSVEERQEVRSAFTADSDDGAVESADQHQRFQFDCTFGRDATQEAVYDNVGRPIVDDVLEGYHGTILAYGPTGSGKTYCMFGPHGPHAPELQGLVPRVAQQVFDHVPTGGPGGTEVVVECSFFEVYCEQLRDFLRPKNQNLQVKEMPQGGFCVEGLTYKTVNSAKEALQILRVGLRMRAAANTRLNQHSSRSHAIFALSLHQLTPEGTGTHRHRKLTLVDLAGSEKVHKSGSAGEMLEEAKKINSSLSALGHVIDALADRRPHVPYRDSRLTRILEDSLGGNCRTTLLVACSPSAMHSSETLSSLRFAARAKKVCNCARVSPSSSTVTHDRQLLHRIGHLQRELASAHRELERRFAQTIPNGHPVASPMSPPRRNRTLRRSWTEEGNFKHEVPSDRTGSQPPMAKSASASSVSSLPCRPRADTAPIPNFAVGSMTDRNNIVAKDAAAVVAAIARRNHNCDHDIFDQVAHGNPLFGSSMSTATGSAASSSASAAGFSLGSNSATPLSSVRDPQSREDSAQESPCHRFSWLIEATPLTDRSSQHSSRHSAVAVEKEIHKIRNKDVDLQANDAQNLQLKLQLERHRCAALTMELEKRTQESNDLQKQLEEAQAQQLERHHCRVLTMEMAKQAQDTKRILYDIPHPPENCMKSQVVMVPTRTFHASPVKTRHVQHAVHGHPVLFSPIFHTP